MSIGELRPAGLGDLGKFTNWSPTFAGSTLGTGAVQEGRISRVGDLLVFRGQIKIGTSPSIAAGNLALVPPVTARKPSTAPGTGGWKVGRFTYFDASTFTNYGGGILGDFTGASGDAFNFAFDPADGRAFGDGLLVDDDFPAAPAVGDEYELWGWYEAA